MMRTLTTWTCMILGVGVCGLVVADALSWEWWVAPVQVAGEAVLDQAIRPATSPVAGARFARPVPRGWEAPSLVGVRDRPDETWRPRLAQLGLPLADQASRLGVGLAGEAGPSMGRDTGALLPRMRLVKDVLDAMPDKCNEKLLGTWYCGISCYRGDCDAMGGEETLRLSVDLDGYERIHRRWIDPVGSVFQSEYRVERKWGPAVGNHPLETGKLVATSCNGRTRDGQRTVTISIKTPDGSFRREVFFKINPSGKSMRRSIAKVRWVGDTPHRTILSERDCWRELAP